MNMRPAITPETITPDELAETLGISPSRVKDDWQAHWSNFGKPIEGQEASILVNFKIVIKDCGVLVGANG
jgi:hypothetical protein